MSLRERLDELDYPLSYPFKLVFAPRASLEAEIRTALTDLLGADRDWELSQRPSRNGNYVAVTISLDVRSAAETESLHRALAGIPGLMVSL